MKTRYLLMLILCLLILGACKNEGEAYEEAKLSNDVSVLSEYLADYPDAPTEHIDTIQEKMYDLAAQEEAYLIIVSNVDIVDAYTQAESYMQSYPNGIYAKEIQDYMIKNTEAYEAELEKRKKEQYESLYGEIAEKCINYKYIVKNEGPGTDHSYIFTAPEFDGRGYCIEYKYMEFNDSSTGLEFSFAPYQIINGKMYVSKGKMNFYDYKYIFSAIRSVYRQLGFVGRDALTDSETVEKLKNEGFKFIDNNTKFVYKDKSPIMESEIEFGSDIIFTMNPKGQFMYNKALLGSERYDYYMQLLKELLPIYENHKE